ncbi:DNA-binding response regulator [Streptomyces sp. BSE7F]|nr:DNA-binding response regulator [Streptomyces sp. BSE7F]
MYEMTVNLFVVSDNAVSLAGLEAIVDQDEECALVGRATDDSDDLRCLSDLAGTALHPDVVVLSEPSSSRTVSARVRHIACAFPDEASRPHTIVVAQNDDDEMIVSALRAGVNGYLSRLGSADELLRSLKVVARGGAAFCPSVAARMSRYFSAMQGLHDGTGFPGLTSRELEILELLAGGMGNRQIARRLFLAEKTVRNYVSRIFAKLEVHDRATAVVMARDAGFGEPAGELVRNGAL